MNEMIAFEGNDQVEIETPEGAMTFTTYHALALAAAENRLKMACVDMGNALREIRDGRLFYLRNCESMEEYLSVIAVGRRSAYRYMQIADLIAERTNQEAFLQAPQTYLLDILRDSNVTDAVEAGDISLEKGKVVMPDGEELSYQVFVKRLSEELREEVENDHVSISKYKKQRDAAMKEKKEAVAQLTEAERTTQVQNQEIQRLRDTVSAFSDTHSVTEERLKTWASKDAAMARIAELIVTVEQGVTMVNGLHDDLMGDSDVISQVAILKTLLDTARTRIQTTYGPAFFNLHPSLTREMEPEEV